MLAMRREEFRSRLITQHIMLPVLATVVQYADAVLSSGRRESGEGG